MEVELERPSVSERAQVVPSAMTLSTDVYWIPVTHDFTPNTFCASKVSQHGHAAYMACSVSFHFTIVQCSEWSINDWQIIASFYNVWRSVVFVV